MYTNVQIVAIIIYTWLQNVVEIKTRCDRSNNPAWSTFHSSPPPQCPWCQLSHRAWINSPQLENLLSIATSIGFARGNWPYFSFPLYNSINIIILYGIQTLLSLFFVLTIVLVILVFYPCISRYTIILMIIPIGVQCWQSPFSKHHLHINWLNWRWSLITDQTFCSDRDMNTRISTDLRNRDWIES